jgi:hypothetical protein
MNYCQARMRKSSPSAVKHDLQNRRALDCALPVDAWPLEKDGKELVDLPRKMFFAFGFIVYHQDRDGLFLKIPD